MNPNIERFSYLWREKEKYALFKFEDGSGEFAIVDLSTKTAIIIESDNEYRAVIKRMRDEGAAVVSKI